jgi:hypothetical protein
MKKRRIIAGDLAISFTYKQVAWLVGGNCGPEFFGRR